MFLLKQAIRGISGDKKTLLCVGVVMLVMLSVIMITVFYTDSCARFLSETADSKLKKVYYRFNPDYQWMKDDFFDLNGSPETIIDHNGKTTDGRFNNDGSMDKYDIPTYVDRRLFEGFSSYSGLSRSGLAYAVQKHGVLVYDQGRMTDEEKDQYLSHREQYEANLIYGGSFDDFRWMSCGYRQIATGFLDVEIVDGREHQSGECMISAYASKLGGYELGDIIYIDDFGGNKKELTISGFFTYSVDGIPEDALGNFESLRLQYTNPFFRIRRQAMRYMVIADFDTVYSLDPEGGHEINSYIACFELKDRNLLDDFSDFCGDDHDNSWMMVFYPDYISYYALTGWIPSAVRTVKTFRLLIAAVLVVVISLLMIYLSRKHGRDDRILSSLGVSTRRIMLQRGIQTFVPTLLFVLLSVPLGYIFAANLYSKGMIPAHVGASAGMFLSAAAAAFLCAVVSAMTSGVNVAFRWRKEGWL